MIPVQRKAGTKPETGEDSAGALEVCMALPGHRESHVARPRRRSAMAAVAGLTAALLALVPLATGATSSSATTKAGKVTFTVGITQDVDSLNPFSGYLASSYEIYSLNYTRLTDYGLKDFSATPSLATSWESSPDGLTWTYHLTPNAKFSDGTPLTAKDVVYSFNRVRNGKYEQTNYGNYVASITSVTSPDDTTVVMKVKEPTPVMLHPWVYILPEHVWKSISQKQVKHFANEPGSDGIVGSGPFVVKEHKTGQFIRLARNPNYWGPKPKIDELVFRVFQNKDSMAQALRRGEIDFAEDLSANIFNSLKGAQGITTKAAIGPNFDELSFNTGAALDKGKPIGDGHPALKDKRVRLALAHAIDIKTIIDKVYGGYAQVPTGIIPAEYKTMDYDPGASRYTFDIALANTMLDDAGYKKGKDGVRTMPDGTRPLKFRLFGRSNSAESKQTVQFIAGWFKQVGVIAQIKIVSEDALTSLIGDGKFDMFQWGWGVEPDPNYQLSTFLCSSRSYEDSSGNVTPNLSDSFYCNKAYDALFTKQSHQTDEAERAETVKQMQGLIYDDAPYVVLAYYGDLQAYRSDRFTGFTSQPPPDGVLLFQQGIQSYLSVRAATAADKTKAKKKADGKDEAGSKSGLVIGGVVGGAALLGVLVFVGLRGRRRPESEIE
jgi:peptide/nickel transport system substrate-binding protein